MIYCLVIALFTYLMDWLMCQDPTDSRSFFFFFKIILKERGGCQEFHQHSQRLPTGVYSQWIPFGSLTQNTAPCTQ